ncbi:MAG TPA: BatA domain-containing protein [Thermoanaerobaculia bacterium]|nr:BatA domain-containing protein [Thermoanaerobaculia bacterium]
MSLGLAAPLWLLGLLGLLAPLVLHLLARGRGRRVRVGSVRLLGESPPRRPRRVQLQWLLLLALRCLLLALVALALAGPRLRREAAVAAAPRPWVLVEPGVDANAVESARRAAAAEAEVRMLAPGLPKDGAVTDLRTLPDLAAVPGGTWSLLREAAAAAPAGTRLVVVTSGRLAALRGERPAFANAIEWHEVPDPRVTRGAARAVRAVDRGAPRSLRLAVLAAPGREGDERYVRAGLDAAAEAADVQLEILETSATPPALTFWLADAPPPPAVLTAVREGGVLVTDSGAPEERCGGTFVTAAMTEPAPRAVLGSVALHRCGAVGPMAPTRDEWTIAPNRRGARPGLVEIAEPQRTTWVADSGRAVLVEQALGSGRWLRFASRFHPAWSELVLSPAFPEWLRELLRESAGGAAAAKLTVPDWRSDGGQGRPAAAMSAHRERSASARSPAPALPAPERAAWLLLFPLLIAERWLATRR